MFSASPNWPKPAGPPHALRTGARPLNHEMDAPNAPIPRTTVELPGPAPFSQATQLTIWRLPQSVYVPIIR
jgi:hypothetical protein